LVYDGRRLRTLTIVDNYTRAWRLKLTALRLASTLSPRRPGLRSIVRFHAISRQRMVVNSFRRRPTNGRTRTAWKLTSRVLASRPITRRMSPLTTVPRGCGHSIPPQVKNVAQQISPHAVGYMGGGQHLTVTAPSAYYHRQGKISLIVFLNYRLPTASAIANASVGRLGK